MKNTAKSIVIVALFGLGLAQKQVQEDPCKTKSRVVADANHCDRYWECQDGQPELYDCPNGLVYAGKNRGVTEGCDYPWRASYCDGKTQANGPIGKEHCDWLYGIFGHETSCTRYWTCWNGTSTEQLCIGGLLYNENTHSCDWPENVDGCQKHPLCNEDANGNVPLGKSCNRYWQCQGGYPRLQRCPAMLVFDKRTLRCVVPPTEDCELPTTVAPPPEDDDEDLPNIPQQRPQHQSTRPQHFQQAPQPKPQSFTPAQQPQQQQVRQRPQQQHQQQQHQTVQQRNDYYQAQQQNPHRSNNQQNYNQHEQTRQDNKDQQRADDIANIELPTGAIPISKNYQEPAQQHHQQQQPQQRREYQQKNQQRHDYHNYQAQQQNPPRSNNQQNYNQHEQTRQDNKDQLRADDLANIELPTGAIPINKRQRN